MKTTTRYAILAIVLVAVVVAIWALQANKPAAVNAQPIALNTASSSPQVAATIQEKASKYPRAIELADPSGFINTKPFKLADLIGKKVILVDFWTYSCINCQRTLPYLTAWYQKYKDYGLEIVGVHSPEFDFEKVYDNVKKATEAAGVTYPVVMDNNMATWNAYHNRYWPHEYLIGIDGFIVHDHIGEGGYEETETEIQKLLQERAKRLGEDPSQIPTGFVHPDAQAPSQVGSPETYFGSKRNQYFGNGTPGATSVATYTVPNTIKPNLFYFGNKWSVYYEYAKSDVAGATITYKYTAKNVYMVAHAQTGVHVQVLLDGKPIPASMSGSDVKNGEVYISDDRLYNIVQGSSSGEHTLELKALQPGLEVYTFTFG